jgi:hypothetical protein
MSRYRWLRPLKCRETMEFFPSTKDLKIPELEKLLFEAVSRGDIRGMFKDEIVPKVHIGVYLSLYAQAYPDQEPHTLPPDLALNYDDLCAVFDRPVIDGRTRGRPKKEHSGWSEDRHLAAEMHGMLAGRPGLPRAKSAAEAARILVEAGRVSGSGTEESLRKRLERTFRKYYSS